MNTIIGLIILGFILMIAIGLAQVVLTALIFVITLPIIGISALIDRIRK